MRRVVVGLFLLVSVFSTNVRAAEEYALDRVPRMLPAETRRVRCDRTPLVRYRGTAIRYQAHVEIHRDFVPYVARFERIVREVSIETFGRAPRALVHHGSFNCRTIRSARDQLSEHAFGNALDVRGFDFGRARRDEALPEGVPSHLTRAFRVRVEDHWHVDPASRYAPHSAFLRALCDRLVRERDLFRVMLGPAFPGHHNHFHFDRAPFTHVQL